MTPTPKETLKEINKEPDRKERKESKEARKKEEEDFDIDEALNNPEFVEFLAKFPDAESLELTNNDEKVKERYFRFKDQKELSKALKGVFVGQIEVESGFKMKEGDFEGVDEHIGQMSIEDPGRFEKILNSKRMFERSVAELQKTQGEVKEILGKLDKAGIEKKVEELTYVKKNGFFKALFNKEIRDKKKDILEKYEIDADAVKEALETEKSKVKTLGEIEKVQEAVLKQFLKAQQELLSKEFEPLQQARQKVLEKVMESLAIIDAKPKDKVEVGEVDAVAEKLRMIKASGNYVPEYQNDLDMLEKDLQEMTQNLLQGKLDQAVEAFGDNKISTLEKSLKNIFDKMTARGLNTGENKRLVIEKLENLADKETSVAKKLLIKRMIIKINK